MPIASDVSVDFVNKRVYHTVGGTSTIYTVNQLYSFMQNTFDELTALDDDIPMSAQTPTAYTMINGWYIEDGLTKLLSGGAIQTSGYLDEIRTLHCGLVNWTNFVTTDIGKVLTGGTSTHTGTVLDYDNTNYKITVRMTSPTDTFNVTEAYTVAGSTAAGTSTAISTTGESIYSNPFTLGTLNTTNNPPQLYIFQNGEILSNAGWFGTGHFDVLIKVRESGVDIDGRKITVFDRNWGDTYTHFVITLTTSGQDAVPLGNADDLDVTSTELAVQAIADTAIGGDLGVGVNVTVAPGTFTYDINDGNGLQTYDVQVDCNGQPLSNVYEVCKWLTRATSSTIITAGIQGQEYLSAVPGTYTPVVTSPFGTFAGGKFFGARGVYFLNLNGADAQNFQLIDAANITRQPPNFQAFSVNAVVAGDRVAVFKSTGAGSTTVDKAQYASDTSANITAGTNFRVTTAIPTDTPASGTIFIVNTATGAEEVLTYNSWAGADFTLASTHAGGYTGVDTAYVPYLYAQAAGTSVAETGTIYSADRSVVTRVRIKGILPFETTGTYGTTGYTATAIRTVDSIVV